MNNQIPKYWQKTRLGKVAGVLGGFAFKSQWFNHEQKGYPVIKIQNIGEDGFVNIRNTEYVDAGLVNKGIAKFELRNGDFIVAMTGATAGKVGKVQDTKEKLYLNQRVGKFFVKNPSRLNYLYLFYSIINKSNKNSLKKLADGSAQGNMSSSQIEDTLEISFPENIVEQQKIVSILSSFDDKIEINNKISKTLEEMAQAIFKEWFVNFRFPGYEKAEFIDSELGKIPVGWHVGTFSEIVDISKKSIIPNKFKDEEFLHYSIPAFDTKGLPIIEKGNVILSNKFLMPENCILISKLNPRIPRIWLPEFDVNLKSVASTEFIVLVSNKNSTQEFINSFCTSKYFQDIFQGRTTGTSTSHQRVRPNDLLNIQFIVPPDNVIAEYTTFAKPTYTIIKKLKRENQKLLALRDLFLPKLMKGEIRV